MRLESKISKCLKLELSLISLKWNCYYLKLRFGIKKILELDLKRISEVGHIQDWFSMNVCISESSNLTHSIKPRLAEVCRDVEGYLWKVSNFSLNAPWMCFKVFAYYSEIKSNNTKIFGNGQLCTIFIFI
jgi:hypothetical protein